MLELLKCVVVVANELSLSCFAATKVFNLDQSLSPMPHQAWIFSYAENWLKYGLF